MFREVVVDIRRRHKFYVWKGTYVEVCALLSAHGYGLGKPSVHEAFKRWVGLRYGRPELLYFQHVLASVFPGREPLDLTADENAVAVRSLMDHLLAFLDGLPPDCDLLNVTP